MNDGNWATARPCGSRSALKQESDPTAWAAPYRPMRTRSPEDLTVDRLAVSENMDAGARGETSDSVGECHAWPIDQIGALGEAYRPPGSPVHRDCIDWVRAGDRLSRLPGIEMAGPKARPPSCDRHKREVDVYQFVELMRGPRPRDTIPVVALNQIADRRSAMRASRVSPAIVVGREDVYPYTAEPDQVTGSTSESDAPRAVTGLNSRRDPAGTMRTAEAGISRSDGRWAWSACRWEISTMSACAACGGGTGPRTRRRWPRRAVRTGSKRTAVSPSRQVQVPRPHQVSVAVMACRPEAGCCQITARYGRSEAQRVSTARASSRR